MVDASTGSFQIEAVDYGTEGPVTCTLSGADFTCQPQRATPALGWTYRLCSRGGSAHLNRFKDRPRSNTLGSIPTTKRPSAVPVSILKLRLKHASRAYLVRLVLSPGRLIQG